MGARSKVEALPRALKKWLDRALIDNNFSGYEVLSEELKARGYDIGKSSVHRYGENFESRVRAVKVATEQAKAVVEQSPDDDNAMNAALIRLVQERVFSVLVEANLPESIPIKDLSRITKSIADVGRASVQQAKYRNEVKERAAAAAEDVDAMARQGGVSDDTIEQIKRRILGIPP